MPEENKSEVKPEVQQPAPVDHSLPPELKSCEIAPEEEFETGKTLENLPEKRQDQIYAITGTVKGPITQGMVDVFVRYLRKVVNKDEGVGMDRLMKVDARIWAIVLKNPDFIDILDAIMIKTMLGVSRMTKEQREWFKLVQTRAGLVERGGPGKASIGKITNAVIQIDNKDNWIDPQEGSLPDHMKAGIRGLDPAASGDPQ